MEEKNKGVSDHAAVDVEEKRRAKAKGWRGEEEVCKQRVRLSK